MRMRQALFTVCSVVALAACGGGSGGEDAGSSTTLSPLGTAVFRTIPATTTTLSSDENAAAGAGAGGVIGSEDQVYIIKAGDYPNLLATRFGCTWAEIAGYNELNPEEFPYPDEPVKLPPACTDEPTVETVADSTASGTDAAVTTTKAPAADGSTEYTIVAGDYPIGVAQKFDCSYAEIAAANGLAADGSDFPFPDDTITIPGKCDSGA